MVIKQTAYTQKRAALPTERPDNGLVLYPNFKELGLFRIDPFAVPCYVAAEDVISGLAVCANNVFHALLTPPFCFGLSAWLIKSPAVGITGLSCIPLRRRRTTSKRKCELRVETLLALQI